MICEMMKPLQLSVREYALSAAESAASLFSFSAGFDQGTGAVAIVARITVIVRSG
jgi:hypothetical protein